MTEQAVSAELTSIADRYERRRGIPADRYSMLNPSVWQTVQERERALLKLVRSRAARPIGDLRAIEVGCGHGGNLLDFLRMGFAPENLSGIELLPDRADQARGRLPASCKIMTGDALAAEIETESLDIVLQSTVFSSILDPGFQGRLAAGMWQWLRPGGAILWYDFAFDNPRNQDVKGIRLGRIRDLFPEAKILARKVTLAPPISRPLCKVHPVLYSTFNALPFLRTHLLCWIEKST